MGFELPGESKHLMLNLRLRKPTGRLLSGIILTRFYGFLLLIWFILLDVPVVKLSLWWCRLVRSWQGVMLGMTGNCGKNVAKKFITMLIGCSKSLGRHMLYSQILPR